jgi:prepilin-type N-terminal cleavage/methylation domain-containing protein
MLNYVAMKKSPRGGFTLAELLLSVMILAVAMTQVMIIFMNCASSNENSRNLSVAMGHAEFVLEDIRSTPFSDIAINIANGQWTYASASAVTAAGLSALKNETITTASSGTNPLNVTVTVNWEDHGGRTRSKILQTLVGG